MRHDTGCEGSVLRITVAKAYSRFCARKMSVPWCMLAAVALSGIRVLSADSIEDRCERSAGSNDLGSEKLEYNPDGIHAMSIRPIPRLGFYLRFGWSYVDFSSGHLLTPPALGGVRQDLPSTRYPAWDRFGGDLESANGGKGGDVDGSRLVALAASYTTCSRTATLTRVTGCGRNSSISPVEDRIWRAQMGRTVCFVGCKVKAS